MLEPLPDLLIAGAERITCKKYSNHEHQQQSGDTKVLAW